MSKPVKSFRIDQDLIDKAKELGLDVAKIIENALSKAVKSKKCPYCGEKYKSNSARNKA
jgi:post-segregation antitoxin (ccd killing protein)